jgi:hypothetical protein
MASQIGPGKCYGCFGNDHMLGECPWIKELVRDGIVIYDINTHKYSMPDGRNIMHRAEESLSEAVFHVC